MLPVHFHVICMIPQIIFLTSDRKASGIGKSPGAGLGVVDS
jgi:hypothetical protein